MGSRLAVVGSHDLADGLRALGLAVLFFGVIAGLYVLLSWAFSERIARLVVVGIEIAFLGFMAFILYRVG